ncbi:MAG: phenylalanine--tRNA ligase subunit beta, partial [Oscillospiraceae bacterium]|nr:phenylalanine--tRNA ligase subunit beta [Oscillospiraceae bacterium]
MKLSNKWLNEYVKITAEPKEFADRMTMSGSKAEGFEDQSVQMKNVVAGRVTAIERHPDSDHMWVTEIDVGEDAPITIVTGAQNVSLGDTVPVAKHKSLLPTGQKIEKGKLRGIKSEGMLCSLSELCLDTHDYPECIEDGIMILAGVNQPSVTGEDILPGQDIRQVLGLDDVITDFEITNNRPDCLSVIGLAREAAVTFGAELTLRTPEIKSADAADNIEKHLKITVMDAALCPRYTAKMIKDIKIAPSPVWLRRFLRASGVRPINNIVDITNLVMLEYGQPMHAFDYKCLTGGEIVVRTAAPGETITTLDGNVRGITPDMLVIADSSRPVGLAGVMGGENSEITEDTKYAVFESALFDGVSIRRAASALGMRTDASSRFEKGLDIENTLPAVERACELVELLGAGTVLGGTIDVRSQAQTVREIAFEPDKINALLGTDIPEAFMRKTLTALGFSFNGGTVKIPSWRGDVEHYSDLAEEAARFYGYDKIAPRLYLGRETSGGLNSRQSAERRVSSCLRAAGYSEVYTYSFIGTEDYDK